MIRRYCVLPGDHELVAVTLWVVLTHLVAEFDYAPRLVIRSAEKRSGKSRLLEVIDALAYSPLRAVNATVAYIFRSLTADPPPTLLFDECDTIFGSKKVAENNEELRGLLNAGFQRGLTFGRTVGPNHVTQEFATFAMAALAGIGRMPETIEDRGVVVKMKRRTPGEVVHPYRLGRDGPKLNKMRDRIAEWANEVRGEVHDEYPDLPVDDRAADLWEPLVRVADLAGGQWPKLAREAAEALVDSAAEDDTARSTNLQLLEDIKAVFVDEFMQSDDLCSKLRQLQESPWEQFDLNRWKLGRRLREYEIKTRHSDDKKMRGYHRSDFADAFTRYLPPVTKPSKPSETVPQSDDQQEQPDGLDQPELSADDNDTVPDTSPVANASHQNSMSKPIADGLDGLGRFVDDQAAESRPRHLSAVPTGGVSPNTPGQTDRVARALAKATAHPRCTVCSKPVVAGQGNTHLSCIENTA